MNATISVANQISAVLFVIAKYAPGIYSGNEDPASTYGGAGSVMPNDFTVWG